MIWIRPVETADVERLLEVERGCVGAPHWSEGVWRDVLLGGAVERAVLVAGEGVLQGFVVVSRVEDVAEVESLGVAAEARRRGVARALCEAANEWAKQRGAAAMELEVRAGNEAALALYAGLGFVEQGRRTAYYRDPVEDAVRMRLALANVSAEG